MPFSTAIYRLDTPAVDDYPSIDWRRPVNSRASALLLENDARLRAGADPDSLPCPAIALRSSPPDFLFLAPGIGLSHGARVAFEALNVQGLHFLRLSVDQRPFYLVYTSRVVDCLDLSQSDVEYFNTSPSRIKLIRRYAFKAASLHSIDAFTLPQLCSGAFTWSPPLLLTRPAKDRLSAAKLITPVFTLLGAA